MNGSWILFTSIVLALLIFATNSIFGQTNDETKRPIPPEGRREFGRMPPPEGFNPRVFDQLNLSSEQKQQIRTLEEKSRADSKIYFERLQVVQEKLKDTTETEVFDETEARKLLKEKAEIQTELELIRLRTQSAIFNLLSAEQIAQLGLLKQQRPEFPPISPPQK